MKVTCIVCGQNLKHTKIDVHLIAEHPVEVEMARQVEMLTTLGAQCMEG